MKQLACAFMLAAWLSACSLPAGGQVATFPVSLVEGKFFLRHNLAFIPGQTPRLYSDNIVFIENQKDCHETIWPTVIGRGAPVKVISAKEEGEFLRLTIVTGLRGDFDIIYDKVDVLLALSDDGGFQAAFENVFANDEVEEIGVDTCAAKTENELIEALGYPIYRCRREDGSTLFYYNLGFLGHRVNSYHDIWFEAKDGKVIGNYGNI